MCYSITELSAWLATSFSNLDLFATRPSSIPVPPLFAVPSSCPPTQPSQPHVQLDSPFQWPLLSMCRTRKSGTQCMSLSKLEHTSLQAICHHFVFASLASFRSSLVFPPGGGRGVTLLMFLWGCGDTIVLS